MTEVRQRHPIGDGSVRVGLVLTALLAVSIGYACLLSVWIQN